MDLTRLNLMTLKRAERSFRDVTKKNDLAKIYNDLSKKEKYINLLDINLDVPQDQTALD